MKIYIDIDGVILNKDLTVPEYGTEFISFLTSNYDFYWLATHCKGSNDKPIDYLSKYYPDSSIEELKMIKPTDWTDLKTEAIDFNADFIWLEDYPFESEKKLLMKANKINSLVIVNLNRKNELMLIQEKISIIFYNN